MQSHEVWRVGQSLQDRTAFVRVRREQILHQFIATPGSKRQFQQRSQCAQLLWPGIKREPTRIDGRDVLHRFAGIIDKAESRLRGDHGFEMSQRGRSSGTVFSHDADDTGLIPGQARFDDVFKRQHIPGFRGNDSRSNRCSQRAHGFGPVENGKRCTQDTISGTAVHK